MVKARFVPFLVLVAVMGGIAPVAGQSRNGIESAPLLPPAGVPSAPSGQYPAEAQPGRAPSYPQLPPPGAPRPAQPGMVQPGQALPAPGQGAQSAPPGTPQQAMPPVGSTGPAPDATGDVTVVQPPKEKIANPTAVYAGLDKITGRITSFEVAMGETVQFGALQVTPRACYTRPPTETTNTTSFTEVNEITLKGEAKRIFTGWMFASSPGLHGVEHPIFDVWLTDCKATAPATGASAGKK